MKRVAWRDAKAENPMTKEDSDDLPSPALVLDKHQVKLGAQATNAREGQRSVRAR